MLHHTAQDAVAELSDALAGRLLWEAQAKERAHKYRMAVSFYRWCLKQSGERCKESDDAAAAMFAHRRCQIQARRCLHRWNETGVQWGALNRWKLAVAAALNQKSRDQVSGRCYMQRLLLRARTFILQCALQAIRII